MSCIDYHKGEAWELEEPVPCPECGEWYELQDSRQSLKNALRLLCPECHDAEQRELKEEIILDDVTEDELANIEESCCQHFVKRKGQESGRCGSRARGFVKFITDKGAACDLYVCRIHYRALTDKLDKNDSIYKSEIL